MAGRRAEEVAGKSEANQAPAEVAEKVAERKASKAPAAGGSALCQITLGLTFCSLLAAFWRRQLYSRPPRFGEANCYCLLRRPGAVFAFPNVFHFFTHKLASLSTGRLAFALVLARAFNYIFFWHNKRGFAFNQPVGRK